MSEFSKYDPLDDVVSISQWLKQGKLLVYPTESVWGVGCDAMNETAVQQILSIKNRPVEKGMIVVTDSIKRIEPLLMSLSDSQRSLITNRWANLQSTANIHYQQKQATTWLLPLPADVHIPNWITGDHKSVAVRVIAHPLIQRVCAALVSESNPFGFLISTSCNPAGETPAITLAQAEAYFARNSAVKFLKGEVLGYTKPSEIRDVLTGEVLR